MNEKIMLRIWRAFQQQMLMAMPLLISLILISTKAKAQWECVSLYVGTLTFDVDWQVYPETGRGYKPYWAFAATAGKTYSFSDCYGSGAEQTAFLIMNNSMQRLETITTHAFCEGNGASGDWTCPATGNYYVALVHWSGSCDMLSVNHAIGYRARNMATWTGAVSSDWAVAGNWSINQVPSASYYVNVPASATHPLHITSAPESPAICAELIIQDGASVVIDQNAALTVTSILQNLNATGGIIVESGGSLLHNNNGIQGTVKRWVSGNASLNEQCYHFVSIPLHEAAMPTANLFNGAYLFNLDPSSLNESTGNYGNWAGLGSDPNTALSVNQGYMVYYPDNAGHTFAFSGMLNNGPFNFQLTGHLNFSNYTCNLVPNPYPSFIDWQGPGWNRNEGVLGVYYIWNPATRNYVYYSYFGFGDASRYIAPGQSFVVPVYNNPDPVFSIDNDARVHADQAFYKSSSSATAKLLNIKASNGSLSDEAFVWITPEGTAGPDPSLEAPKLFGNENSPQLYTTANDSKLSINALPELTGTTTVTVSFECGLDGVYELAFNGIETFEPGVGIFLTDEFTATVINLRNQEKYSFTHTSSSSPARFTLTMGASAGISMPNLLDAKLWVTNATLYIDAPNLSGEQGLVEVINMLGQVVYKESIRFNDITMHPLKASGPVTVKVTSRNRFITHKAVITQPAN